MFIDLKESLLLASEGSTASVFKFMEMSKGVVSGGSTGSIYSFAEDKKGDVYCIADEGVFLIVEPSDCSA